MEQPIGETDFNQFFWMPLNSEQAVSTPRAARKSKFVHTMNVSLRPSTPHDTADVYFV
jgi:hypothetical protein